MLQWVGVIGIMVMAIAMLPFLRVGGMQLFRMESSDKSEKVLPRIAQLASQTSAAYAMLTLGCAAAYALAGMTGFEAVTHAMATVSTGGRSEEHTSELQSLMRISYAVFCLKKKKNRMNQNKYPSYDVQII